LGVLVSEFFVFVGVVVLPAALLVVVAFGLFVV